MYSILRKLLFALLCLGPLYGQAGEAPAEPLYEPGMPLPGGRSHDPGIALPAGEGRELLATACTRCHNLKGLPAYQDYWGQRQWRMMVDTMVKNGAELDAAQMEIVTNYLAEHFGPGD